MRLRIITPLAVVVDEDIESLRAEDASGSFGILNGHAPFLTSLEISILSWRTADGERFCAVRGGVLTVDASSMIDIATREAVTSDDLATLDSDVLAQFRTDADNERSQRVEAMRLQFNAIRHMVSRRSTGANVGEFR